MADINLAIGTAVRLMMARPVFDRLPFGELARTLESEVRRGHYGFVVDGENQVRGFLGWALAPHALAETWAGGARLVAEDCMAGDTLIVNRWVEADPAVHRFMVVVFRSLTRDRSFAYARRLYPDGRQRVMRLRLSTHRQVG